jgi:asparagine synthase (glutamine-hydrolysing)
MCGIAGIIGKCDNNLLETMLNLMDHRGPDGRGVFIDENIILGHNRLAILDLSENGKQPFNILNFWMVFNGEIYNYLEIKIKLESEGVLFKTNTDTEVLLQGYIKWGIKFLNNLKGMFSFCIYDSISKEILIVRDNYGIKPLYYKVDDDNNFHFSSEIKPLLNLEGNNRVNYKCLLDFLVYGITDHSGETMFNDIFQLLPGYFIKINLIDKTPIFERYYYVGIDNSLNDINHNSNDLLQRSIDLHIRSDVQVGTCLSGGLDSSLIAGLASKALPINYPYFAIHSNSIEKNESAYAMAVSKHFDFKLNIITPSYEEFNLLVNDLHLIQEQPFGSPSVFMQYLVMKEAKKCGIKVILDGQGGDEVFLGYNRYLVSYLNELLTNNRYFKFLKDFIFVSRRINFSVLKFSIFFIYFRSFTLRKIYMRRKLSYIKSDFLNSSFGILKDIHNASISTAKIQKIEIEKYILPQLLRYEDRNSMANSIEARVPYVERDLIENNIFSNYDVKVKNGWLKYGLRKIAQNHLPDNIIWRKDKYGFESPNKKWLTLHDKEIKLAIGSSKILSHVLNKFPNIDKIDNEMKWRLYSISVWENIFKIQF